MSVGVLKNHIYSRQEIMHVVRPPDTLYLCDFTHEADLVCGICGAHEGYKTAEVRDVRRIGGGRGLCGGAGKRMDGVFDI